MMGTEIERKFLIEKDLWYALKKPSGILVQQAYLINEPEKVIRIRVTDSSGYLTIKGPAIHATRSEYEFQIPKQKRKRSLTSLPKSELIRPGIKLFSKGRPGRWMNSGATMKD
jgi:CYTH domain-containing protein